MLTRHSLPLMAICLLGSSVAWAQQNFIIRPAMPRAFEAVYYQIGSSYCYGPEYVPGDVDVSHTVDGRIEVRLPPGGNGTTGAVCQYPQPWVTLGRLPRGSYTLSVYRQGGSASLSDPFEVLAHADSGEVQAAHDYSGIFWDEARSGSALYVHQPKRGSLAAVWATFDDDGKATWYLAALGSWGPNEVYRAFLFRARNGASPLAQTLPDAPGAMVEAAGTMDLRFDVGNVNRLTIVYTFNGVRGEQTLSRFVY